MVIVMKLEVQYRLVVAAIAWLSLAAFLFNERSTVAGENWPAFRGADSRGVADDADIPSVWSSENNVKWKVEIPGRGWSSPVVWQGKVFLTTCVDSGAPPEARKGLYFGGEQNKAPQREHRWIVYCLELGTGKILWEKTVNNGIPATPVHVKNTYASETPIVDAKHVYATFGNLGIFCLTHSGEIVWKLPIEPRAIQMNWGPAASPVLDDGKLYFVNDNQDSSYLQALDAKTGKELWRVTREEQSNWATPFIWKNPIRTEIITPGTRKTRSYDLSGRELWEITGSSPITIATPYEAHGLLYVTSGYVLSPKKPIFAIRPGASGNISLTDKETSNDYVVWCQKNGAPYNPSTIVYRDRMYVLYDRGLFGCFNALTGEEIYPKQRLGSLEFTSSPWASNGKIYCLSESGETFVIAAKDQFEELGINRLGEDDMCMATPAIAGNSLLIRTLNRIYCLHK